MKSDDDKYDSVIDINSIRNLKNGWKIKYNGDKQKVAKTEEMMKSANKSLISVLGHSNRGKTYILQKICKEDLHPGYEISTKGISLKMFGENCILLDTVGTNAPLLVEDENNDPRDQKDFYQKKIDDINLCQIITNYIVQTFVIQHADILICVVGMLTSSEQQFLNKIKKNCMGKKQLIVIHNLIHFYEKDKILDYIENTLKKSIIHDLEDIDITEFDNKDIFNKYYIEKGNENGEDFSIKHFIIANDSDKNNKDQVGYFNEPTINYIRNNLTLSVKKDINLLDELRQHIQNISSLVLNKSLENVEIIKKQNNEYIICNEEIEPKEVTADELNNIYFIGKEYTPLYRYYLRDDPKNREKKYFTIEIKICSKIKNLKVLNPFDTNSNEFTFNISGERDLKENKLNDNTITVHELMNKRKWIKFQLEFKVNMDDLGINAMDPNDESDNEMRYGLLYLNFNVQ